MVHLLQIELFGGLKAQCGERDIARFRTQKEGALFAYLACHSQRPHLREQITEMLWPEAEPEAGRNRLKQTLSTLRRQLEPPGVADNSVLIADRIHVRLNPAAFSTDAQEFEKNLKIASRADTPAAKDAALLRAVELYRGELLPDYYEDWILTERQRLSDAFVAAVRALIPGLEQKRDFERALDFARRALAADSYFEEAHCDLMRLLARLGRPAEALRHYRQLETTLLEHLDAKPGAELRQMQAQIARGDFAATLEIKKSAAAAVPASVTAESLPPTPDARHLILATLPLALNRFFGRKSEITRLTALLIGDADGANSPSIVRLVTVTGPGGCGKSRLVTESARRLAAHFEGAVWFAPLAEVSDPRQIADAVADALGIAREVSGEPMDAIVKHLGEKRALLVLDNMEQLLAADNPRFKLRNPKAPDGAAFVWKLLSLVPNLTCLVTSRLALELSGEHEFPLAPLPVPNLFSATPEALWESPSVQLFVDRAQAATPDFQLTPRNAEAVATLCAKLDGIPLAIELAAARVRVFSPAQMLGQLARRFDFLVSRQRNTEERHRGMRAAIEWSFFHLPPELRDFFVRLSVFRGGWTIASAQAVCGPDAENEDDAFYLATESLSQLRVHSLIIAEEAEGGYRFRMLETLREYAQEHLGTEAAAETKRRHAAYFTGLAQEAEPHFNSAEQPVWMARLAAEYDNFQAALNYCVEEGAGETGLRIASAFWRFWLLRGYFREGREILLRLLAAPGADAPIKERGDTLSAAGNLAIHQSDYAAAQIFHEQALSFRREINDVNGIAASLNNLGVIAADRGDFTTARARYEEALALFLALGNRPIQGYILNNLANVAVKQGDFAQAVTWFRESLAINRESKSRTGETIALSSLGEVAYLQNDFAAAKDYFSQSLAIARELGDRFNEASVRNNLGSLAYREGDYNTAQGYLAESLRLRSEIGDKKGVAAALEIFAYLAAHIGQFEISAQRLSAAEFLREQSGLATDYNDPGECEKCRVLLKINLSEPDLKTAFRRGREIPLDVLIQAALQTP